MFSVFDCWVNQNNVKRTSHTGAGHFWNQIPFKGPKEQLLYLVSPHTLVERDTYATACASCGDKPSFVCLHSDGTHVAFTREWNDNPCAREWTAGRNQKRPITWVDFLQHSKRSSVDQMPCNQSCQTFSLMTWLKSSCPGEAKSSQEWRTVSLDYLEWKHKAHLC